MAREHQVPYCQHTVLDSKAQLGPCEDWAALELAGVAWLSATLNESQQQVFL